MSSVYDVMKALQVAVKAAVAPLSPIDGAAISSGVGWPPVTALQNLARNGGALITIYDRKVGRNTTRWSPYVVSQTVVGAGITTSVNAPAVIPALGTGAIMLGGAPKDGDAVSCVAQTAIPLAPNAIAAIVAQGDHTDTPSTMATKLAGLINADSTLGAWLAAAAVGAQVNLTSLVTRPVAISSFAGNGGTQVREVGRSERQLQVVVWTRIESARETIVGALTSLMSTLQTNFGLVLPDGTPARLTAANDFPIEDDTLEDVYRHDFLETLDFPITTQDQLFAVLAPVPAFAIEAS